MCRLRYVRVIVVGGSEASNNPQVDNCVVGTGVDLHIFSAFKMRFAAVIHELMAAEPCASEELIARSGAMGRVIADIMCECNMASVREKCIV